MPTLDVSPSRIRPAGTRTVTFIGGDTSWLSDTPTFEPSGLAGVSAGVVSVVSDTVATAAVTYGANLGLVTWTDSTTGATRNQRVMMITRPLWIWRAPTPVPVPEPADESTD